MVEPFFADLRMNEMSELLDSSKLKRAYEATLKPQLELAKTLGFVAGWTYRNDIGDIDTFDSNVLRIAHHIDLTN